MYRKRALQKIVNIKLPNQTAIQIHRNEIGKFECKCGANLKKPQSLQRHWKRCAIAMASETSDEETIDTESASSSVEEDTSNLNNLQKNLKELNLIINTEKRIIVCGICKCIIQPKSIIQHLYRLHKVKDAKTKIENISSQLPAELDTRYLEPTANGIDPVEGDR